MSNTKRARGIFWGCVLGGLLAIPATVGCTIHLFTYQAAPKRSTTQPDEDSSFLDMLKEGLGTNVRPINQRHDDLEQARLQAEEVLGGLGPDCIRCHCRSL